VLGKNPESYEVNFQLARAYSFSGSQKMDLEPLNDPAIYGRIRSEFDNTFFLF